MKIDKIEIQTSNKKHATDIAMLVDKPEFLLELKRLREKWRIKNLQILKNSKGRISLLDISNPLFFTNIDKEKHAVKLPEFNQDVEDVLKKFNRGKNFRLVVIYALLTGIIPTGIYQSCYFDVVTINEPEDLSKPEKYQYIIVMSARAEKQEVEEAFKEFVKHREGKIKLHNRIPLEKVDKKKLQDAIDTIKREQERKNSEPKRKLTPEECEKVYREFIKRTKNAYDFLLSIGDLNSEIPDHMDLIEQYHEGNIYNSAIIDAGNRRDLDRAREWNWIRFRDYINGNGDSKKIKTYEEIAEAWNSKCPKYPTNNDKEHDKNCKYCHVKGGNIGHTLSPYNELLEIKGMKF